MCGRSEVLLKVPKVDEVEPSLDTMSINIGRCFLFQRLVIF